jgi:hypothetical protein
MTVILLDKYTQKETKHEYVQRLEASETCFGITGWGLHFEDGTYCLQSNKIWGLVKVEA